LYGGCRGEIGKGFLVEVRDEFEKRFGVGAGGGGGGGRIERGNAGKDFRGEGLKVAEMVQQKWGGDSRGESDEVTQPASDSQPESDPKPASEKVTQKNISMDIGVMRNGSYQVLGGKESSLEEDGTQRISFDNDGKTPINIYINAPSGGPEGKAGSTADAKTEPKPQVASPENTKASLAEPPKKLAMPEALTPDLNEISKIKQHLQSNLDPKAQPPNPNPTIRHLTSSKHKHKRRGHKKPEPRFTSLTTPPKFHKFSKKKLSALKFLDSQLIDLLMFHIQRLPISLSKSLSKCITTLPKEIQNCEQEFGPQNCEEIAPTIVFFLLKKKR
jgi:hypothetical protein